MRITYVTHTRFPTEKAHGHQVAQVCAALGNLGHNVTLVAPTVWTAITDTPFAYYGVPENFTVVHLAHFDALKSKLVPGKLSFGVSMWLYGRVLRRYLVGNASDVLYVRSSMLLPIVLRTGMPVILELHSLPRRNRAAFVALCNRCRLVVCLTSQQSIELLQMGVSPERVTVEGDGVDPARFAHVPATPDAKNRWGLPSDRPVIGYVGALMTQDTIEKGVGELIAALAILKKRGQRIYGWIVGGPEEAIVSYRALALKLGLSADDGRFQGPVSSSDVPSALAACDVLVYPAPGTPHPYFLRDTSPLKLFEYLASGRPMVCADLPPIRDVVDASVAHLCPPGDSAALADAIAASIAQPIHNPVRRRELVEHYSWKRRMERILRKMSNE